MVTVELDPGCVEFRLVGGKLLCPSCRDGVLVRWGFARARRVVGVDGLVRPRRSRCRGCLVTHVLLPVSLLLRRGYAAEVIWAVLKAKAAGGGHRVIAERAGVPACTVRGWLRVISRRVEAVRGWFLAVAVAAGVDVSIPAATGTAVGDVLAAVAAARAAIVGRFGESVLGAVTVSGVAVACSGGRLLSPGWPAGWPWRGATPVTSVVSGVDGSSSRG
jgi:hypothetical protein